MFSLPLPPSPVANVLTAEEHAAGYTEHVRAACEMHILRGRGEVSVPEALPLRDYPAFWSALASHMDGTGWTLAESGYRDLGGTKVVVPVATAPAPTLDTDALEAYLLVAYDAGGLYRLVRWLNSDALTDIPTGAVSPRAVARAVVDAAVAGKLPGLRERMMEDRPARRLEVEAIRGLA